MDCENIFQGNFCAAEAALRTARLRAAELPTAATQPSPERGGQVVDLRWGISEPQQFCADPIWNAIPITLFILPE